MKSNFTKTFGLEWSRRIYVFLCAVCRSYFLRSIKRYKLRPDVIARLLHDIQISIEDIATYSEYIEEKTMEPMLGFASKVIRENSFDMIRLVNSFHDIERLDAGEIALELSDVDMMNLIRDVIAAYQVRATELKLRLIVTRAPGMDFIKIKTDLLRFQQMLDVITFSSLQFSMPHSTVQLHVDFDLNPDFICLSYTECGAGMLHPDIRLIERFWNGNYFNLLSEQGPGIEMVLARALLFLLKGSSSFRVNPSGEVNLSVLIPLEYFKNG
jgi:signal transduction histidine kinase